MPRKNPKDCWICGKPVILEEAGLDEFGAAVHEKGGQLPLAEKKKPPPLPPLKRS